VDGIHPRSGRRSPSGTAVEKVDISWEKKDD
jgi:hypothetical protein